MENVKMSFPFKKRLKKKKYVGPRISFDKSPLGWERLPTPVFCPRELTVPGVEKSRTRLSNFHSLKLM